MTAAAINPKTEPDRLARKLFIMTMFGAWTFIMLVLAMTHFLPQNFGDEGAPVAPLVNLVHHR